MFHGNFQFIDDLCALNDGGEFQKSHKTKFTQVTGTKTKTIWIPCHFSLFGRHYQYW